MKSCLTVVLLFAIMLMALPLHAAQSPANPNECVSSYDATVDYFPDKVTVEAAAGFTVEYFNNYKRVTVTLPWQGAEAPLEYLLIQCGTPAPDDAGEATIIEVPVQTV
ncbi:MAG: ABC transporter substrate-binding protein, partial [Anaerolineae bacterium]|nr:ABC transporter substrate-binding protein [Anaerolineae bacterium]